MEMQPKKSRFSVIRSFLAVYLTPYSTPKKTPPFFSIVRSIIENNTEDTAVCRAFYKITEVYSRAELSFGEDWTAVSRVGNVQLARWTGKVCRYILCPFEVGL